MANYASPALNKQNMGISEPPARPKSGIGPPHLKSAVLASSGATTASHAAEGAASAAEYLRETRTAAVGALGILPPPSAARTAPPSSATASYDPKWQALRMGATLQCVEAATLGMPFEVWKTRMGRFRECFDPLSRLPTSPRSNAG